MRRPRRCASPSEVISPSPSRIFIRFCVLSLPNDAAFVDQHLADVFRIVQQNHVAEKDAVMRRPPVTAQVFEQQNRVARLEEFVEQVEGQVHPQTRRIYVAPAQNQHGKRIDRRVADGEILGSHALSLEHPHSDRVRRDHPISSRFDGILSR